MDNSSVNILQSFTSSCCCYLTGSIKASDLFRKHKANLSKSGDFSYGVYGVDPKSPEHGRVSINNIEKVMEEILHESLSWALHINACKLFHFKTAVFLDRPNTFKELLRATSRYGPNYGRRPAHHQSVYLTSDIGTEEGNLNLSNLRVCLQKEASSNLLTNMGYNVEIVRPSNCENLVELLFYSHATNTITVTENVIRCPCAIVVNAEHGLIESNIMAADYLKLRLEDMKVISEHKYGPKVKLESGWEDLLCSLRDAAVAMDLLCTKPSRAVSLNLEPDYVRDRQLSSRGASFVMYNCARISEILKQFKIKVGEGFYPPLISMDETDFTLLSREEEWELLFNYILVYPNMIQASVDGFEQGNIRPDLVCQFLSGMCRSFSVYYRRVRILTEPRSHLLPLMFARLYLLQAIEQVLHNALRILDIVPVSQM